MQALRGQAAEGVVKLFGTENVGAIESRVTAGILADVVWGNHQVVDNALQGFGEIRALTEWFELKKRDT